MAIYRGKKYDVIKYYPFGDSTLLKLRSRFEKTSFFYAKISECKLTK